MVIASMAAWLTPTVLFCVLNLVIATIFIASNFKSPQNHHGNSPGQLARSPSLLQRVQSVNLSSVYTTPESETTDYNSTSQLNRAPSLLQRVKSIDFSFSSFYATPHDYQYSQPESEQSRFDSPSQLARAPSLLERVKSIKFSSFYAQDQNPVPTESEQLNDSLSRTSNEHSDPADPNPDHDPVVDHLKSGVAPARKSSGKMKKSRSEKRFPASDDSSGEEDVDRRRPATARASVRATDENVDAKADDFINRFKQQLKLQRLDSIARLKEMLNRGC